MKKKISELTFEEVEKYYDDNIKGCKGAKCNDGEYCPLSLNHSCMLDVTGTKTERKNIDNTKQVGEYLKEVLDREIEVETE